VPRRDSLRGRGAGNVRRDHLKNSPTTADARGWEELAQLDPLWAVASSPQLRHGKWDEEEFYAVGRGKVRKLMKRLDELRVPERSARAPRLRMRRRSPDIAARRPLREGRRRRHRPSMLALARTRAAGRPGLEFRLDDTGDQSLLAGESFDLVYCGLVLQHLPSVAAALACLERLCAAVGPGGALVVQIAIWLRVHGPLRIRQRLYTLLRRAGRPGPCAVPPRGSSPDDR